MEPIIDRIDPKLISIILILIIITLFFVFLHAYFTNRKIKLWGLEIEGKTQHPKMGENITEEKKKKPVPFEAENGKLLLSTTLDFISSNNGITFQNLLVNISNTIKEFSDETSDYIFAQIALLRDLGFIKIDKNQLIQPSSTMAGFYLQSMRAHLIENIDFISDWKELSSRHPLSQIPRNILLMIEERRASETGLEQAIPIRQAKVSLALIKGKVGDEFVYLTQQTKSGGLSRYHFIGGNVDENDFEKGNEFEVALYREMHEELDIDKTDVFSILHLCTAHEKKISARLGILTEYIFQIFFVQLNSESTKVKDLLFKEHIVETYRERGEGKTSCYNKWQNWHNIQENLSEHANAVINAINKANINSLPLSIDKEISKGKQLKSN